MSIEELIRLVDKERKKYKSLQLAYSKQRELCDSIKNISNKRKLYEKELKRLEKVKTEFEKTKDEYSSRIFEVLSQIKPDLIIRKTHEIIPWDNVYAADYEFLSVEQIRALIPMIEEDGGMYRINNT